VIDDHSPESAEDICMAFADERIRYIKNDGPSGMAHARNKGVSLAKGEFIAMSDQDDISLPDRLLRQIETFQNDDALLLLGTWRRNFGLNELKQYHPTDPELIKMGLLKNMNLINPSIMFRRTLFSGSNLRFQQNIAPADDYDFVCQVALLGKISNVPEVLLLYRIHEQQTSIQKKTEMYQCADEVRKVYMRKMLASWIPYGLNVDKMAEVFSTNRHLLSLSANDMVERFTLWTELNELSPLWDKRDWHIFLGKRVLDMLPHLKISKWEKLRLMYEVRILIFAIIMRKRPCKNIELIIRRLLK